MVVANGWTLYETPGFEHQKAKLEAQVCARKAKDPVGWAATADAKLLNAIERLTLDLIPADPGAGQFRQGGTLGKARKHWFRAKFGNGRYRLFFQYHSAARIIIHAWVKDAETLRTCGATTDAYAVFKAMLDKGDPPDDWEGLGASRHCGGQAGEASGREEGALEKAMSAHRDEVAITIQDRRVQRRRGGAE